MIVSTKVDTTGLRTLVRLGGKIDKELRAIIRTTAAEARRELVMMLNRGGTGKTYAYGANRQAYRLGRSLISGRTKASRTRVRVRTAAHRASAPGQPPARLTGTLVRSIKARAARSRRGDFVFVVFADPRTAYYRHFLEFGTKHSRALLAGGNIEPRPFINPVSRKYVELLFSRLSAKIGEIIVQGS